MSFLGPKFPDPPQPPQIESPEEAAAREKQRRLLMMAGNRANMYTGPMGLTGPAPVAQKMLLGS